jgi:CRISPR-associated autoregulator DevR family
MSVPTHVAGTFLIYADASFLNGAGLGDGENRNVTVPKTLRDLKNEVPYVSSQAWKRWLRNTLIEETGWPASELRAIDWSEKKSTSKIAGELDPISYAEDDLFGYMRAQEGQGKRSKEAADEVDDDDGEDTPKKGVRTKALVRASPFAASLLVSLRKTGWRGRDEGFVHLKEGTPLPYATEFYTTRGNQGEEVCRRRKIAGTRQRLRTCRRCFHQERAVWGTPEGIVSPARRRKTGRLRNRCCTQSPDFGRTQLRQSNLQPLVRRTEHNGANLPERVVS